jgi:Caspase domain
MQLRRGFFFASLVFLTLVAPDAFADKRVALVIGNSAYKHTGALPNPTKDAAAMSMLFRRAGFDVIESRQNLSGAELRRTIRDFTDKVRDADIAVVFYAGHGIEVDGTNYLIPVDAMLERDVDVEDETVSVDRLVRMLDPAKRLRLVILDACRDNPFAKTMKRTSSTRSVGRGLAKVEPTSSDTLIAFAAKAGSTASDGSGENSPFTLALMNNLATPGLDLRIAFGRVRDEVLKNTGNRQEPFVYGSLGGTTVTLVSLPADNVTAPPANVVVPPPVLNPTADIRRDYELVSQVGTKEAWESFLSIHTTGLYADLARAQLAKIIAEEAKKAKPQTAAKPEPDKVAPPAAPPTTPRSADAPKANTPNAAQSGTNRIVCGARGCQEVKPGCRVQELGAPGHQSSNLVVVCN